jgi:chemotaxis protein MotB
MPAAEKDPIIIVRKKRKHGGHHGGAWKVAYADFVTALMSLFIVLWLVNSSKPVQEAVGGYFRDPYGAAKKVGKDIGAGEPTKPKQDLTQLKKELLKAFASMPGFDKLKDQIEITVTDEGLRIELLENPKGTFFENGSSLPTPILREVLTVLASEAGRLPNPVSIEGHTDSRQFTGADTYTNWELSTDRANAARRLMESSGLRNGQVIQVRGYADRKLRKPAQPQDASNRRISVLIQYLTDGGNPKQIQSDGKLPKTVPAALHVN